MNSFYSTIVVVLLFSKASFGQSVVINELMASNDATIADATGDYSDWIELYNPSASTVDLSGYYVTDKPDKPKKHRLPPGVSIGPNSYLILWASDEPSRGITHLPFKLSADGEHFALHQPDGQTLVDGTAFGPQREDISWGRQPDGAGGWHFLVPASPGASNAGASAYEGILDAPAFSDTAGFYTASFDLSLSNAEPGATIYYTLDGSQPDPAHAGGATYQYKDTYPGPFETGTFQSLAYQSPITITDRTPQPNDLSLRNTSSVPGYPVPAGSVFKGTVVRAAAFKPGYLSSPVVTNSYFVTPQGAGRYTLPVFSLALDESDLFDYNTGIYTAGITFEDWLNANPDEYLGYGHPGNYYLRDGFWEKQGNFEMYDNLKNEWYSKPAKLEIHGGFSRGFPGKSIRVTIQEGDLDEQLLPDRPYGDYNSFVLRNSGNGWGQTLMRDGAVQRIMEGLRFDTQGYRPGVLFLNGEYWGIHNLRERPHEDFIKQKYDIDEEDLDLLELFPFAVVGSNAHYLAMLDFVKNNSLEDDANFAYLKTQMDTENFLDYYIANIYAGNKDWPANNIKYWRKRTNQYEPDAPYGHDGRWRWMMYDVDNTFGFTSDFDLNLFDELLNNPPDQPFPYYEWATELFREVMTSPEARTYFIDRSADLLNTQFLASRAAGIVQEAKQAIAPEMAEHIDRWRHPATVQDWESLFTKTDCCPTGMLDFAQNRTAALRSQYVPQFGLGAVHDLTVGVSDDEKGHVQVNTVEILPATAGVGANPYPWTGQYFQNQPVTLTAKAKPGFEFLQWTEGGNVIGASPVLVLDLPGSRSVVAEFGLPGTCQSAQSGDWHTAGTWDCGRVPTSADGVVVRNGHVVTVSTAAANALSLQLRDGGRLDLAAGRNLNVYQLN